MPSIEWLVAVVRIIRVHNTRAATDFVIFHIVVLTSELFSKKNLFKKEWNDQQVFTLKDFFKSTFSTFAFKGTLLHICCWKIFDRKCKAMCRWSCTLSNTWSWLSENAFSWSMCSNQLFFRKYVYQAQLTMQEFFHITFLEFALRKVFLAKRIIAPFGSEGKKLRNVILKDK